MITVVFFHFWSINIKYLKSDLFKKKKKKKFKKKEKARREKLNKTTKLALYTSAGLIAGRWVGQKLKINPQATTLIGGLIGTISSQPGEWKKITG